MVSTEELLGLFEYRDGGLYGKHVPWRRKASNTRVVGKSVGSVRSDGYHQVSFTSREGKKFKQLRHRIIFAMHYGYWPELVDHIDQNPSNDRIENLRDANKSLNALNTSPRANNKTGIKGVFQTRTGRYEASVWDGRKNYLGLFDTVEEAKLAIEAYNDS